MTLQLLCIFSFHFSKEDKTVSGHIVGTASKLQAFKDFLGALLNVRMC